MVVVVVVVMVVVVVVVMVVVVVVVVVVMLDSGYVIMPGWDGRLDSSTDGDDLDDSGLDYLDSRPGVPPAPSGIVFEGEAVIINGRSNLQRQPRSRKRGIGRGIREAGGEWVVVVICGGKRKTGRQTAQGDGKVFIEERGKRRVGEEWCIAKRKKEIEDEQQQYENEEAEEKAIGCYSIYCNSLWSRFKVATLNRLKVCHNDILKRLLGLPRWCSSSLAFARNGVNNLDVIHRHSVFSLRSRVELSANSIITSVRQSSAYVCGPIQQRWLGLLFVQNLKISFDDASTSTYEYPSENYLLAEAGLLPVEGSEGSAASQDLRLRSGVANEISGVAVALGP
ncbi:hypothetical protein GWK47_037954 [Chionoecetes opilio]|uniref:Uncharacterized protein n=1 Tax=Chionoecetes opilio TaxID=41210 RepID=A0A8J4YFW7_CHIOP|nr:hypothetical protein GWK47_037954 [Chionoecetes opilio]